MLIKIGQGPDHGFDDPLGLLSDCHRRIEHFLQILVAVTDSVAGGRLSPAERRAADAALLYFANAAPKHTADEEQSLFPRLRSSTDPRAQHACEVAGRLEHDHRAADGHHAAVDALVRRWLTAGTLDADAVAALRVHLDALQTIYAAHIAVEDRELFPAARHLLSRADVKNIGREMAARRGHRTPQV
jgi:hemerythrin-like domain-containing protein